MLLFAAAVTVVDGLVYITYLTGKLALMGRALQRTVIVGADMLKVKVTGHPQRGGGKRGKVTRFSEQSRKRMLELVAMIRLPFLTAFFVTLTYPGEYSRDPQVWKRDLDAFLKRLRRRFPDVCGIWRLEFQKRGAPHYHFLVWGINLHPFLFRRWVKLAWYEVVGSGEIKHFNAGTGVEPVQTRRRAGRYVSKYAAKVADLPIDPETGEILTIGRWWGRFGELPTDPALVVQLDGDLTVDLRRLVAKLLKSRGVKYWRNLKRIDVDKGFTAFGVGDLSYEGWQSLTDSTAFRMVSAIVMGLA